MRQIDFIDLGVCGYAKALDIQHEILGKVQRGEAMDTLLLLEHPHVLTMGRRAKDENIYADNPSLKEEGMEIFHVNRGGDVTYHGYGQIVGYLIFDLSHYGKDIRRFVTSIEDAVIDDLMRNHGISASAGNGKYTGVWVGGKKICAIGIGVKKWVSYHGFAFNVNTDLKYFNYINPCGLGPDTVTSLQQLKGAACDMDREKNNILDRICSCFDVTYIKKDHVREGGKDAAGTET